MSEPVKDPVAEMQDRTTNVLLGLGVAFLIVSLGFIALKEAGFIKQSGSGSESADVGDEKAMAITMAQNFVKDRLKSPSSASFPWGFNEYQTTRSSDGTWRVSGWVESVNSFNAKVRVSWSVEIKREGTSWKLFSINVRD